MTKKLSFIFKSVVNYFVILLLLFLQTTLSQTIDKDSICFNVSPKQMLAGGFYPMEIIFNTGGKNIQKGGGIRIELPVAYLETAPSFWDTPQIDNSEARGFVEAKTEKGVQLPIKIYGHRNRIVECLLEDSLQVGEKIYFNYSSVAQSLSGKCIIRAQWRESSDEDWIDIIPYPEIVIMPHNPVIILAVTPMEAVRNENFDLSVSLLDKFGNLAANYKGTVEFSSTDSLASLPGTFTFTPGDSGRHTFHDVKFGTAGFQKINITDGILSAKNNYSFVTDSAPTYRRYFGDTHFHTGTGTDYKGFTNVGAGGDHRGHFTTQVEAYKFARDVMHLDFASAAEHDTKDLNEKLCDKIQRIADSFYEPGKFTTYFAYEWTAAAKVGHHVIVFKEHVDKIFNHFDYSTKLDLFNELEKQKVPVIVIPHPMWAQSDHEIWNLVNNKFVRIGEIYSLWCSRFLLQPGDDTQRFELGGSDPWSFQYAWKSGHKMGVIGSSDNHTGRPGLNNFTNEIVHAGGLAVVLAKENNREKIWEALENRRTYATTGTRIYLDFTCNDHFMGEEFDTAEPLTFRVRAAGTNKLASIELVKYDHNSGYQVIKNVVPDGEICEFQFTDSTFSENSFYYVRVKQVDEVWRGAWAYPTAEMAWSSPIWINYSSND